MLSQNISIIGEHSVGSLKHISSKPKRQSLKANLAKTEQTNSTVTFNKHPFVTDSYQEKLEIYCKGNNTLRSLNLACMLQIKIH